MSIAADLHLLATGDAIYFSAAAPHSYRNRGATEAIAYLVMTYPENLSH